jgi:hypothetical protein
MRSLVAVPLLLVASSPSAGKLFEVGHRDPAAESVSLIAIVANPEKYDGKHVQIRGAFRTEFEGNVVCVNVDDLTHSISKNCIWFNIGPNLNVQANGGLSRFNNSYMLLEGKFSSRSTGHLGMNSGSLENVWRIMELPSGHRPPVVVRERH